jgi:hypothetical protein
LRVEAAPRVPRARKLRVEVGSGTGGICVFRLRIKLPPSPASVRLGFPLSLMFKAEKVPNNSTEP